MRILKRNNYNEKLILGFFSKLALGLITAILFSTFFYNQPVVLASETVVDLNYVYDEAELLSQEEYYLIEEMSSTYGKEAGIDIIILTHDNPNAKDGDLYIEDFYDQKVYGTAYDGDSAILLIDMSRRDIVIHGYGQAETYLHSKRINVIIEEITPYLTSGDYYQAFELFIQNSAAYMKDDSELNYDHNYQYNTPNGNNGGSSGSYPGGSNNYYYDTNNNYNGTVDSILTNVWFQLLISLVIGGIVVGVMAYNSGGKITVGSSTYMDQNHSGLIGRRDTYLHTHVTRVRRPQNNTPKGGGFNAGGFSGGVSSGGHSHSSGRGSF